MLRSNDDANGNPIAFSALSGLSYRGGMLYSVEDSFYARSRIIIIDPFTTPTLVTGDGSFRMQTACLAAFWMQSRRMSSLPTARAAT